MLNFNSILISSAQPEKLVEFYKSVFSQNVGWSAGEFHGFQVGSGGIMIGPHQDVSGKNPQPGRVMFNLETPDIHDEFLKIKGLGATVITEPYQPMEAAESWIATFADPDGNYFQLMTAYKV